MNLRHLKYNLDILNVKIFPPSGVNVPFVPQSDKKKVSEEEGEEVDEHEASEMQPRGVNGQCTFCAPVWQEQDEEEEEHEASESYLYGINNKCQYFPP